MNNRTPPYDVLTEHEINILKEHDIKLSDKTHVCKGNSSVTLVDPEMAMDIEIKPESLWCITRTIK